MWKGKFELGSLVSVSSGLSIAAYCVTGVSADLFEPGVYHCLPIDPYTGASLGMSRVAYLEDQLQAFELLPAPVSIAAEDEIEPLDDLQRALADGRETGFEQAASGD